MLLKVIILIMILMILVNLIINFSLANRILLLTIVLIPLKYKVPKFLLINPFRTLVIIIIYKIIMLVLILLLVILRNFNNSIICSNRINFCLNSNSCNNNNNFNILYILYQIIVLANNNKIKYRVNKKYSKFQLRLLIYL